jgi:hypothetical protein
MLKKIVLNLALLLVWLPGSLVILFAVLNNYFGWDNRWIREESLDMLLVTPHIIVASPVFIFNALMSIDFQYGFIFSNAFFVYIHIRILRSKKISGQTASSNAPLKSADRSDDCGATATEGSGCRRLMVIWLIVCGLLAGVALLIISSPLWLF